MSSLLWVYCTKARHEPQSLGTSSSSSIHSYRLLHMVSLCPMLFFAAQAARCHIASMTPSQCKPLQCNPTPEPTMQANCLTPRQLCYDDLARLPYLNAVIDESMRLFPVAATGSVRCVCAEVMLPTTLCICICLHMFPYTCTLPHIDMYASACTCMVQ
jgi:Cytochrome P450